MASYYVNKNAQRTCGVGLLVGLVDGETGGDRGAVLVLLDEGVLEGDGGFGPRDCGQKANYYNNEGNSESPNSSGFTSVHGWLLALCSSCLKDQTYPYCTNLETVF